MPNGMTCQRPRRQCKPAPSSAAGGPPAPCTAGTNAASNASPSPLNVPLPPRDGSAHMAESSSAHCFITVDLDLNAGYVRFFRNGHLIVSAFTGVTAPVSPAIAFVQAPGLHCQVRVCRALLVGWDARAPGVVEREFTGEVQPRCGWETTGAHDINENVRGCQRQAERSARMCVEAGLHCPMTLPRA